MNRFRGYFEPRRQSRVNETLAAIVIILVCQTARTEDGLKGDSGRHESPPTRQLATLANADILESSGLAASYELPNSFWTHNDSGDTPRLFAFDDAGRDLGVVLLIGVTALDWEDMASFRRGDRGWLLVADVGDNGRRRETCQLHLLPEPALGARVARVHSSINFRYEHGPIDCEAVGVDETSNTVLLASKSPFRCEVFALQLPSTPSAQILVARSIANISVPLATALDVSPDGTRAIVLTYTDAFEFQRRETESWSDAFKRQPQVITMPIRKQGESICYAADRRSLFLTSERQPTPLWKVERTFQYEDRCPNDVWRVY
ncbi:MAG: hypothetical protein HYV60_18805 [Planctomycetia bacterium]|nr:hypothetical protein [Planctomycetia bacterium]